MNFATGDAAGIRHQTRESALLQIKKGVLAVRASAVADEDRPMTAAMTARLELWTRGRLRRRLAQAIPAQAIAAIPWHRQAKRFLGAPAWSRQAAAELGPARGACEIALKWLRVWPICHEAGDLFGVGSGAEAVTMV
jgi:hypothetical protein